MNLPRGYAHPAYAEVYRGFGIPHRLEASGGTVLLRNIAGTDLRDAMGCYPIFCCHEWQGLATDLEVLARNTVSLVLVADPFHGPHLAALHKLFDHVVPFKTHYIADTDRPIEAFVPKSRLRAARRALRKLTVEIAEDPPSLVDDWLRLQVEACTKRRPTGMNVLPREAVERLFAVVGLVVLRAVHEGNTVGMHVVFHQDDVVFGHFGAYSAVGYRLGASTALHVCGIEYFSGKARWIDWGGVPGGADADTGLSHFKQDFSSTRRTVFLCGRVFDRATYERLTARLTPNPHPYFPAYRQGELI